MRDVVVLVVRASALAGHEGFMGSGSKGLSERDEEAKGALHHASILAMRYLDSTRCLCGLRIINEVKWEGECDSLHGKLFASENYEDDGLHFRHPWVFGVQEEIESLTKRVKESEEVILLMAKLKLQIETLEEQVHDLNVKVRCLKPSLPEWKRLPLALIALVDGLWFVVLKLLSVTLRRDLWKTPDHFLISMGREAFVGTRLD
ncbi:hypothetical protein Bca52824_089288 [Brassica carinata]|uniref:Uncharacterized protein n=1 Tax=Brassica carinata TaxID=52824 RepID=A0A8X7TPF7_BRACI|nr:hypothetical protein Bca52824_089288 [Brassica carinata]